jgi:hypothetical protein
VTRVGLGRHGRLESEAGDPLDGLVNLFDLGLVLAVAFLIAGLSIGAARAKQKSAEPDTASQRTLTQPRSQTQASGRGQAIGQVYRLADGRLVLVGSGGSSAAP